MVSLWVQNAAAEGSVTCRIKVDGKTIREATADGAYAVCRIEASSLNEQPQAAQPDTTEPAESLVHTGAPSIAVPDVRGLDGATARDRLREAGFSVVGVEAVNGKAVLAWSMWQVVDQSPGAGTKLSPSDGITLRVDRFPPTKKPEPTRVTDNNEPPPAPTQDPAPPSKDPAPPSKEPKSTDPKFASCTEANANGYGPYTKGVHEEYYWYQDRDDDGVVCER
jgi:hypothetical protein